MHLVHSERDAARLAREEATLALEDIKVQLGALQRQLKVEMTRNRELLRMMCCFL